MTQKTTYAKQQLGSKQTETKLLGLPWDKSKDTLSVVATNKGCSTTKRSGLSQLAKIYDPLGWVSPTMLSGKVMFRETCEVNYTWDGEFPESFRKRWKDWYEQMPERYKVPRTLVPYHEPITTLTLHAFGDESKVGVVAAVYVVVEQAQGTTQGLVCVKSHLAKRNLTIPRLELIAGHMAINLISNVEDTVGIGKVSSVHCWLDATVALYWINGQGEYR